MQTMNTTIENLPKDRNGKILKHYLRVALDVVSPSAGLPPVGAIEEVVIDANMHTILSKSKNSAMSPNVFGFTDG